MWNNTDADAIAIKHNACFAQGCRSGKRRLKEVVNKINGLKDYFVDKSVWIIGGDGWYMTSVMAVLTM